MAFVTLSDVYDDARFKVNKTSTDVSDANLLRISNKILREIYSSLIGLGEDFYTEIATFDLVANQREYTLPADSSSTPWGGGAIKVLRVEAKLDGTNWTLVQPIKFTQQTSPYNETDIIAQFSNSIPYYAVFDNSLFIFSGTITAVTTGARIIYVKRNAELTASSATPDLPNEFLTVLSTGITKDLYERFGQLDRWQLANSQFERQLARLTDNQSGRVTNFPFRMTPSNEDYK